MRLQLQKFNKLQLKFKLKFTLSALLLVLKIAGYFFEGLLRSFSHFKILITLSTDALLQNQIPQNKIDWICFMSRFSNVSVKNNYNLP